MNILIVDDEPLARDRLRALISELGIEQTVIEAGNGRDAIAIARSYLPEVVLLDIRMPGMDGMQVAQLLSALQPTPAIIFTTAYGDRALEAFEHQAVDYLLKPVHKERLEQALKRAQILKQLNKNTLSDSEASRSHISVIVRGQLQLIPVNQIYYFSADQKFVMLYGTNGQYLINDTLKDLEKEFAGQFLRIHRSVLVAITKIESLNKDKKGYCYVKLRGLDAMLEVSRRHLPTVRKILKDMRTLSL